MSVDRSWMERRVATDKSGLSSEYRSGVEQFLNFAFEQVSGDEIRCPCKRCVNEVWKERSDVMCDLFAYGFKQGYTTWIYHGETWLDEHESEPESRGDETFDCTNMIVEAAGSYFQWNTDRDGSSVEQEPNDGAKGFYELLHEAATPLYDGHEKHTVLSAVTKFLHFKNEHDCSERGFNELLSIVKECLPAGNKLPESYYDVKKMVKRLNLGYEKIDACENDCMLYYGDVNKDKRSCDICGTSRYREQRKKKGKDVPRKILRYFPIAPRLQRLFMSTHTAEDMRWHSTRDIVEGQLTHPADGLEWKNFDNKHPSFAEEVRNVRLGLATDGFNPFNGPYTKPYSTWPVIIVVYNLPPSMCMKDPYMFMPLLIPGDKSPSKDINVYLRPLVDELKMLWEKGVQTYDVSLKQNFDMRAALLWTINDFPALGMISGWSTHGGLSCPVCMGSVKAMRLKHGGKMSFFATSRQFFLIEHRYRRMSRQFNQKNRETSSTWPSFWVSSVELD